MSSSSPPEFCHPSFRGRIGVAQGDITPPVGIYARCWGAATHDVAESIHRPLTVSAMTISSAERDSPLVLVCIDLGFWRSPDVMADFQGRLLRELSLRPEDLIFALSHSHAVPALTVTDISAPLAGGDLLAAWMETLPAKIIKTVREARESAFEATLDWETGRCSLATVRDFPDPDPTKKRKICGFSPDGKADDTLLVGRVADLDGNIRGTIVNYACHPTTLAWENKAISPDYIGAAREVIEGNTQGPLFFLQGASGELAPRYQYVGDVAVPDAHGRQLGHAVLATLYGMEPPGRKLVYSGVVESGAPLARWTREPRDSSQRLAASRTVVDVPLKVWPTAAELQQAYNDCPDRYQQERIKRKLGIRKALGDGSTFPLEIFTWRIGDAVLTGNLGEMYSVFQKELRDRFAGTPVACMNLINGSLGYLPPAELYDEDVYPVWQTPFDRGSLELTIEAAGKSIHAILAE